MLVIQMCMKYPLLLFIILIAACQGKLTDEQKKEMRDGMIANQIKKVSEAEIIDAAFSFGRSIAGKMNDTADQVKIDDLQRQYHVKIYPLKAGDSLLLQIEKQLIEAYTSGDNLLLTDNIQKVGSDSLLYTLPVLDTLEDGSTQFKYALGILMPKKDVILSIEKK